MRSRRFGTELRRLRTAAGLKLPDAAAALRCGVPKISQVENGHRGIFQKDLRTLFKLYGVEDKEAQEALLRLAREIHQVDWWSGDGPLLRSDVTNLLTLEADSDHACAYMTAIPGLLQTDDYTRSIWRAHQLGDESDVMGQLRRQRQELLATRPQFMLRAVIDATTLHRIPDDVRRGQIEHLLQMAEKPNVSVQVLPLDAKLRPNQYPPYTIFTLSGKPTVKVVWLEHVSGGMALEQPKDVQAYEFTWNEMTAAALSPHESRKFMLDFMKDIEE
jgi:transcriptional regulator with XRE-family HTH domain